MLRRPLSHGLRVAFLLLTQEGQHPLTGQRAATCFQCGVGPFAFRYQGKEATSCQHIDTIRKAIDCATTLLLSVFI